MGARRIVRRRRGGVARPDKGRRPRCSSASGDTVVPSNGAQAPTSTGDAIAQPDGEEVAAESVSKLSKRRHRRALASAAATPTETGDARAPAEPIDIFEELAQLPEPEPLSLDDPADPDIFSPPPGDAQALHEWPAFESDPDDEVVDVEISGKSYTSPWDVLGSNDAHSQPVFTAEHDWRYESSSGDATDTVAGADPWEPVSLVAHAATEWSDAVSSLPRSPAEPSAFDDHVHHGSVTQIREPDPEPQSAAASIAAPWEVSEPDPLPTPSDPDETGPGDGDDEFPVITWRPQLERTLASAVEGPVLRVVEPEREPNASPSSS